jgi:DNA-directed RNA polymerase specialized sigma24 family protein
VIHEPGPDRPLGERVKALADAVASLPDLDPIDAAQLAPRLIDEAKSVMAAVRKRAISDATARMTHAEVAARLGVSTSAVNNAIVEHRAALAAHGSVTPVLLEGLVGG